MKLDIETPVIERSEEFTEKKFGIKDMAIIMDILRSKMYPNPIKTITQELMSNARDAHREVKKGRTPIEVYLPNKLQPSWAVRDFGPGISPERMEDVFINYGASTKRENNRQTGGFGLGAKSPFSYVDNFCIETVTPEESYTQNGIEHKNCMVLRKYVAYIDESKIGAMALVSAEVTTEPQGTKIVVSCQEDDFEEFYNHTVAVSEFWPVRPKVFGRDKFDYPKHEWLIDTPTYKIRRREYDDPHMVALLDGIPYVVDPNKLSGFGNTTCYLYFDTGELAITANRESLDYNCEKTLKNLEAMVAEVKAALDEEFKKNVNQASNLWDAYLYREKFINSFGNNFENHTVDWQGITLDSGTVQSPGMVAKKYYNDYGTVKAKKYSERDYFTPENDVLLVWNDEETFRRSKLKTLKDSHPEFNTYVVIQHISPEDAAKINLEKFNPVKLSTIVAPKATGTWKRNKIPTVHVKKFVPGNHRYTWSWEKIDPTFTGQVYYIRSDRKDMSLNYKYLDVYQLNQVYKICGIYGMGARLYKIGSSFPNSKIDPKWIKLEDLVTQKMNEFEAEIKAASDNLSEANNILQEIDSSTCQTITRMVKEVVSRIGVNSIAYKYLSACLCETKVSNAAKNYETLAYRMGKATIVKTSNDGGQELFRSFKKTYPLLVDAFRYDRDALDNYYPYFKADDIVEYINMKG